MKIGYILCMLFLRTSALCLAIILTFALPVSVFGKERTGDGEEKGRQPPDVSVAITGDYEGEIRGFTDLFRKSIVLELNRVGLSLLESDDPGVIIRVFYDIDESIINYSLSAELGETGEEIFSIIAHEELDLTLDATLLDHAGTIAQAVADFIEFHKDLFSSQKDSETEELGDKTIASPEVMPKVAVDPGPVADYGRSSRDRVLATADVGYFFAAGESARYFKSGYALSAFAGYAVSPRFDLGLGVGAMYFLAQGYSAEAQGLVLPVGIGLRLRPESSDPVTTGIRIDGGWALFTVKPETGSFQSKIVPAAELGMTVSTGRKKPFFLGAICLTFFYEGDTFLYGFTPRIGLSF